MKKTALYLLFLGFVFVTVSMTPSSKGKIYTILEGKLKIKFPCDYELSDNVKEVYKTIKISADHLNMNYFGSFTIHETELSDPSMLQETSLNAFFEAIEGEMESKTVWKVKKHRGLKAVISVPGYDLTLTYCALIVGQIQYQIVVSSATTDWNQKSADAFIKSFKLKK